MTSMINLKASRKTGTINVGVNPITNINVNNPTNNAAINIKADGVNPSPTTPNIPASPEIADPIHGPINIGINTDINILIP